MAQYAGKAGVVYISTSGSGAATSIVKLNQWTLSNSTDRYETTGFQDTNKTYVQGFADVTGNLSGFWDEGDDNLYDASRSASGCKMYLYPSSDAATKYFYGPAWVDFSIDVSVSDAIKVAGTFAANGAWGQM